MAAKFHQYPLADFNCENSFFLRFDLICNMTLLRSSVPLLCELLLQESDARGNELLLHFIDTPGVPDSMRSVLQIFSSRWMDRNYMLCHIAFGFKLRNPSYRADYRPEQMPEWWVKALEQEFRPEIRTALLLYADALLFYDSLLVGGSMGHEMLSAAQFRNKFFSHSVGLIIKLHHSFQSQTVVFSTQARKAAVKDETGRKIKVCERCKLINPSVKLLSCSKCMAVRYCSKECQSAHWDEHKPFCKAVCEEEALLARSPQKHFSVEPGEQLDKIIVPDGPEGEVIMGQLDELFRHSCFQCCRWMSGAWEKSETFCSRSCFRKFKRI